MRVFINKTQYFEGVEPEVWEFHIGGYQVLEKWLKHRKGRTLSYDDLTGYCPPDYRMISLHPRA